MSPMDVEDQSLQRWTKKERQNSQKESL